MTVVTATLVVYAYSSFVSSWGIGPEIKTEFEKTCQCKVSLVDAGDGVSLVNRIKTEKDKTSADVVIGFEESTMGRAQSATHWEKLDVPKGVVFIGALKKRVNPHFLPFDYAPYAFIYRTDRLTAPPKSLADLATDSFKNKIVLQNPSTSSVGLGFLLWGRAVFGEAKMWDYFKKISANKKASFPGWDGAYGFFKKSDEELVVPSFWSSPAYHLIEKKETQFVAAEFSEGHYLQVEYMGVPVSAKNKDLAKKFVEFVLNSKSQELVLKKNYMYPVSAAVALPPEWKQLSFPKKILPRLDSKEIDSHLESWLKHWSELF